MDQPELTDPRRAPGLRITESGYFARYISSLKASSVKLPKVLLSGPQPSRPGDKAGIYRKSARRKITSGKPFHAQASPSRAASDEYNWDLNYGEIAKIFRAGCIIRAQFLQKITDAYAQNAGIANLLLAPYSNRSLMTISRRCVMSGLCRAEWYSGTDVLCRNCLLRQLSFRSSAS